MRKKVAVIVAGGKGTRMQSDIPKQFLRLGGEVILIRTLRLFYGYDSTIELIVTLPGKEIPTWESICKKENLGIDHKVVQGGQTRFHSVKNGLAEAPENSIIAIHDGVRPLVSKETISNAFLKAEEKGSAIPITNIYESVRFLNTEQNYPVNREHYKIVQTPQVFCSEIITKAYNTDYQESFTDDASVVEHLGEKVFLIQGNPENIKITTKKDLAIAETLLSFIE